MSTRTGTMPNIPRLLAERQLAARQRRYHQRRVSARPTLRFVPEPIDQPPSPSELDAHSRVRVVRGRPTLQGMPAPDLPPEPFDFEDEPTMEELWEVIESTRKDVPRIFRPPPGPGDLEVTREQRPRMFSAPPSPRDLEVTRKHDMSRLREMSREHNMSLLRMLVAD